MEWRLSDPKVEATLSDGRLALPSQAEDAPTVSPEIETGIFSSERSPDLPDDGWVRIAVPLDITALKNTSPDDARRWQRATRRAFGFYLSGGYRVAGFILTRDSEHAWYVLSNCGEDG